MLNITVLFFVTFLSGISVFIWKKPVMQQFKILLAFSGSYLFSLTVIHILPDAIAESNNFTLTGIFILIGFFFQMILEYFTSGVEHGHIHAHEGHLHTIPMGMFVGLFLHAFLEGMLLYHPSHHGSSDTHNLLFGLSLHKVPEAFALMTILVMSFPKSIKAFIFLFLFALASPLGLLASTFFFNLKSIPSELFMYVYALIAGSFLYISTTIFFEASPNHKFKANRLITALIGAMGAIAGELFF